MLSVSIIIDPIISTMMVAVIGTNISYIDSKTATLSHEKSQSNSIGFFVFHWQLQVMND
jgi:hypothetical protein